MPYSYRIIVKYEYEYDWRRQLYDTNTNSYNFEPQIRIRYEYDTTIRHIRYHWKFGEKLKNSLQKAFIIIFIHFRLTIRLWSRDLQKTM